MKDEFVGGRFEQRVNDAYYQHRMDLALADPEQRVYTVESVTEKDATSCVCSFTEGTCLIVEARLRDEGGGLHIPLPKHGDKLALFGRGIGYEVRGVGLARELSPKLVGLYRYETEEEMKARFARELINHKLEAQRKWDAAKDETAARVAKLPEPFKKRFEFFMRNPSWGPEFGFYELFTMTEAVKIAEALKTRKAIQEFVDLKSDEQFKRVPALDKDHSGNTFGAAAHLAYVYVQQIAGETDAEVFQVHGALCAMHGCENYGCWASTDEAKVERGK